MVRKQFGVKWFSKNKSLFLFYSTIMVIFASLVAVSVYAADDITRPTIISISPENNQLRVSTHDLITVEFSEPMDASTINEDTFIIMQRTTPEVGAAPSEYRSKQIQGTVFYENNIATFVPENPDLLSYNPLQPDQEYGNVFTATITTGAKDLAGNSISRDYTWSFTTGIFQFNTDTSVRTAQLDQSPTPVTSTAPTPTPVELTVPEQLIIAAPVVGTQAATASWFTSTWAIAGLILLLLMILFVIFALGMRSPSKKGAPTKQVDKFGDVYPVVELEGIGPKYARSLNAMGIKNTYQLWKADTINVARRIGAPLSSVKSWQSMAELASLKDLGPQSAEILERSGIHSIAQLKNYDANKLLKLVHQKQDSLKVNIEGHPPERETVEHWIDVAREHDYKLGESKEKASSEG